MRRLIFTIFILAFLMVAAMPMICMGQQPKYGGTVIYGTTGDIMMVDVHKGSGDVIFRTFSLALNNLIEVDRNFQAKPALAESWSMSNDGLEWTFNLRKGVKWHNGREFVADDIKWNFDRMLDPKTASQFKKYFAAVNSVKVIDRYTVKFILSKPSGTFLANFVAAPSHPLMMAPESLNKDGTVTHPIGTGPFEFVEWKERDHIKFKRFKDYWRKGLPYLDEVIIKPIPDETVRLTGVRTGDIHVGYRFPVAQVAELMKTPQKDYSFDTSTYGGTAFITFNCSKPPFNDVRVRQAVAYGIDRKEMLQAIYFGYGWVVDQQFAEGSVWHFDLPGVPQDKQKAKALLAAAGYPNGLQFEVLCTPTFRYPQVTAQVMQAQLKEIGMDIKLGVNDFPTFFKKYVETNFTAGVFGFSEMGDPDVPYRNSLTPDGGYAYVHGKAYNNPKMTALLNQATETVDLNKRKDLYREVVKILHEDCPIIWTTKAKDATGMRTEVKGFQPHSYGTMVYADGGFQYMWLDK